MTGKGFRRFGRIAAALGAAVLASALSGCSLTSRLANIGAEPPLSRIENPVQKPDYSPVSLPMPAPEPVSRQANSLWRAGARAFFKDQRARRVGDLLTVVITIEDEAKLNNTTTRSREAGEDVNFPYFLGYENSLSRLLPAGVSASNLVDVDSKGAHTGKGSVDRKETIKVKLAALIAQVLPNGNLVIHGRQEIRVNYEVRELVVDGVVRPEDISATNTITSEQIAEARIAYGGRGQLSDVQQPRYGQQIFDVIFPF